MRTLFVAVPALLFAGCAVQGDGRATPLDAGVKSPPVEYRSAFEGYRAFADQELGDWRKANDEVGAGQKTHQGHGAHK